MTKRPFDPHLDPLRAPSRAGHHPHLVSEQSSKVNPQQMFEHRAQMAQAQYRQMQARPMGELTQAPPPSDFWKMAGIFGLGALAVYLGYKAAQEGSSGPSQDVQVLPPAAPAAPTTQLVVVPGGMGQLAMGGEAPRFIEGQTALPAPPAKVVKAAKPKEAQAALAAPPAPALEAPKKKPTKKRSRMTSQARGFDGKYLPAGTRKRKIREGSKEKK